MPSFIRSMTASIALLGFLGATSQAADPVIKCHAGKLKGAAKYASCRLQTQSKAVMSGATPDFTKCLSKFGSTFAGLETDAGSMVCPTEGDASRIHIRIASDTDELTTLLAGGTPPDCATTLSTCNDDFATCDSDRTTCDGSLASCTSGLSTCASGLSTCTSDLSTAQSSLATCSGNLATCNTCNSNLTTCNGNLGTCSSNLGTCNGGTAVAGDVLSGKTFSSSAGLGVAGSITNVGQQLITPGTSAVTITQGYHNGAGSVAGDTDLVPSNIANGVNLFGVTGTALSGSRLLKTGQTVCSDDAGDVIACAGTGQDGELQKGVARSFSDNADGTVTDTKTGLTWEKLSDDGSIHDKDTLYLWPAAFTKAAALNSASFAGFNDWRVPNRVELATLLNFGATDVPATYPEFNTACGPGCTVLTCSCTYASAWTSTPGSLNGPQGSAWLVSFGGSGVIPYSVSGPYALSLPVRAVRGGS